MEDRSTDILMAAVREYIESGEPVSSELLYRRYGFGIKPAMIRLELTDLAEEGYLTQPHHSAGRMPTDRGYEFFVDRVLEAGPAEHDRHLDDLFERQAWAELLARLSRELGVVAAAMHASQGLLFKGMLQNLIDRVDWESRADLKTVIRDFEDLDRNLAEADDLWSGEGLRVYIGRKSPLTRSDRLSLVVEEFGIDGERVMICALGPKRMDYERTAGILEGFKKNKTERKKKTHGRNTK